MPSPDGNPLSEFTHTYRFSKMHDKVHWDLHDEIVPCVLLLCASRAAHSHNH